MKSESPFQKITFSAFLFLLKLSVSHNDHEMLSSIRNTLFTETLQIEFITRNSVVSCRPLPHSHTGLALNSAWLCPRGRALCSGSSVGTGCHCRKVGPRLGSSLRREQSSGQWAPAAQPCLGASRVTWSLGSSRCLQCSSWKHKPFCKAWAGTMARMALAGPVTLSYQCHTVVTASQWFLLVQAAPREWIHAQEIGHALRGSLVS